MADYWFAKVLKAIGPQQKVAKLRFTTAGASAPTTGLSRGFVSVVRSTNGVFLATLAQGAKDYHTKLSLRGASSLLINNAIVSAVSTTDRTIQVTVAPVASGTATDTTGLTIDLTVYIEENA